MPKNTEKEHQRPSQSPERYTVVVNGFGGPGAGKTTSCFDIVSEFKKRGFVAEYVPEFATELVWDNNLQMLDGTEKNQTFLFEEQKRRIDRLIGKVDFVVTDSPLLLNNIYIKELTPDFENKVKEAYAEYNNFNFVIERDESQFTSKGRIHNLQESKEKDQEILNMLSNYGLYHGVYNHKTVGKIIDNAVTTYKRVNQNRETKNSKYGEIDITQLQFSFDVTNYLTWEKALYLLHMGVPVGSISQFDSQGNRVEKYDEPAGEVHTVYLPLKTEEDLLKHNTEHFEAMTIHPDFMSPEQMQRYMYVMQMLTDKRLFTLEQINSFEITFLDDKPFEYQKMMDMRDKFITEEKIQQWINLGGGGSELSKLVHGFIGFDQPADKKEKEEKQPITAEPSESEKVLQTFKETYPGAKSHDGYVILDEVHGAALGFNPTEQNPFVLWEVENGAYLNGEYRRTLEGYNPRDLIDLGLRMEDIPEMLNECGYEIDRETSHHLEISTRIKEQDVHFQSYVGHVLHNPAADLEFHSYNSENGTFTVRHWGGPESYIEEIFTPEKLADSYNFSDDLRNQFFDISYIWSTSANEKEEYQPQDQSLFEKPGSAENPFQEFYKTFYDEKAANSFQKETGWTMVWGSDNDGLNGDTWLVYRNISDLPKPLQNIAKTLEVQQLSPVPNTERSTPEMAENKNKNILQKLYETHPDRDHDGTIFVLDKANGFELGFNAWREETPFYLEEKEIIGYDPVTDQFETNIKSVRWAKALEDFDRKELIDRGLQIDEVLRMMKECGYEEDREMFQELSSSPEPVPNKASVAKQNHQKQSQRDYKEQDAAVLDYIKRGVSILQVAEDMGFTPQRIGGYYTLKEHDSVRFYTDTNSFHRFSVGVGGSTIDFAMHFGGMNEKEAIRSLKEKYVGDRLDSLPQYTPPEPKPAEPKKFELPSKAEGKFARVYAYLTKTRCLDSEVVQSCMKDGLIYEDNKHNVVFVGKDAEGQVAYAAMHTTLTNSHWKGDVAGSRQGIGFMVDHNASRLYVSEAPIDALSIICLRKQQGHNIKDSNYMATCSTNKYEALYYRLRTNPHIKDVILAYDNDEAGQKASRKIFQTLKKEFPEIKISCLKINGKDPNEHLCQKNCPKNPKKKIAQEVER
ncbi:DUF3991 and toprim domain-containing protein [Faecalispora anaeroviscerum]|uniref:DUF3991 and toprim domain-containing protein n=1 Tax=Faecalispora anaeroviscerum TaxID=2991836 RepID=UPI0024BA015F|nr:DUF3991 and toprim domain-containing protein [Faecalispora anaeroviscerum]